MGFGTSYPECTKSNLQVRQNTESQLYVTGGIQDGVPFVSISFPC